MPPGRNDPCLCGSGRKYKHCCGNAPTAGASPSRRPMPSADDAQGHYLRGQVLEARGELERAAESFGRAAALRPEIAEIHNDLSEVLFRLGRIEASIASSRRAMALRPRFAAAMGNLANAERARGSMAAAIAGYRQVIALEPDLAEAHRNLGSALLETGEREAAVASLSRALELRADFAGAIAQLARALAELGRFEESARYYGKALERAPDDARLHASFGHVLQCLGHFREAAEHSRRAIALEPLLPEGHLHLGNSLLALNALYEADAAYRAGLEIAPDHAALYTAHAMVERALGRLAEAEASAQRALALCPDAADTLALLGSLAIDHGRFAEAEGLLHEALAVSPDLPEALTSLAVVRKMGPADVAWRESAERVLERRLPVQHAINLHHALGKYADDVGDWDAAFAHHRTGNELARRTRPHYDRADMTERVTRLLGIFDRDSLTALRVRGAASDRPVFVVGMPRSGTSLTEQILASHPKVHGAGELLYWIFAADAERDAAPERRAALVAELGRAYLDDLAAQAPEKALVIDKLPVNFRNIGLIHAALPGARFVHLERHALDTCLSIYFQGFSAAHPYATDFGDLAHYYREYRRLMAHWRAVLPPRTLLDVRYEDLVDDPEAVTRRMLDHIGLPWDVRCLEFHSLDRPVLTASNWQVRQPIGKGSVGRWRRYERFLEPLGEALGDALVLP